jgi:hypothetical protein
VQGSANQCLLNLNPNKCHAFVKLKIRNYAKWLFLDNIAELLPENDHCLASKDDVKLAY